MTERLKARGALIEVVEISPSAPNEMGVYKPNTIRINGTPVLCPKDDPVTVEDPLGNPDGLIVTLRVYASQVVYGAPLPPT